MRASSNPTMIRGAAAAMTLLLAMVAAYYVTGGIRYLMASAPGGGRQGSEKGLDREPHFGNDLLARWVDQHYVLRGRNPYDIYFAGLDPAGPEAYARSVGRDCTPDPELGRPWTVGYPPWSFVAGTAMFGPPWSVMRPYTVLLNLLGLAVIGGWAYRLGGGGRVGALFAAASLACNAYAWVLSIGQATILIMAALVIAYWLAERGHPWACGLLLGIAMFKHTITGPFLLCFLVRGQWKPIASCLFYLALASVVAWLATATDPLEMTSQMLRAAAVFAGDGSGPIRALFLAGVPRGRCHGWGWRRARSSRRRSRCGPCAGESLLTLFAACRAVLPRLDLSSALRRPRHGLPPARPRHAGAPHPGPPRLGPLFPHEHDALVPDASPRHDAGHRGAIRDLDGGPGPARRRPLRHIGLAEGPGGVGSGCIGSRPHEPAARRMRFSRRAPLSYSGLGGIAPRPGTEGPGRGHR